MNKMFIKRIWSKIKGFVLFIFSSIRRFSIIMFKCKNKNTYDNQKYEHLVFSSGNKYKVLGTPADNVSNHNGYNAFMILAFGKDVKGYSRGQIILLNKEYGRQIKKSLYEFHYNDIGYVVDAE